MIKTLQNSAKLRCIGLCRIWTAKCLNCKYVDPCFKILDIDHAIVEKLMVGDIINHRSEGVLTHD